MIEQAKKEYREKGKLDQLLDTLGIKCIPVWRRRKNAQSHARGTMKIIIKAHGEYHLKITLMAIRGSELNRNQLWSETIGALSDVLEARPDWLERPSDLFEAVNSICLETIRRFAVNRRPWPIRPTMRPMIYQAIADKMDEVKNLFGEVE